MIKHRYKTVIEFELDGSIHGLTGELKSFIKEALETHHLPSNTHHTLQSFKHVKVGRIKPQTTAKQDPESIPAPSILSTSTGQTGTE